MKFRQHPIEISSKSIEISLTNRISSFPILTILTNINHRLTFWAPLWISSFPQPTIGVQRPWRRCPTSQAGSAASHGGHHCLRHGNRQAFHSPGDPLWRHGSDIRLDRTSTIRWCRGLKQVWESGWLIYGWVFFVNSWQGIELDQGELISLVVTGTWIFLVNLWLIYG